MVVFNGNSPVGLHNSMQILSFANVNRAPAGARAVRIINGWLTTTSCMKRASVLATVLTIAFSGWSRCLADISNAPIIKNNQFTSVGLGFKNLYSVASLEEAQAKLKRFRELARPISLAEFLGCEINYVQIISYSGSSGEGSLLIRQLLGSIIMSPGHRLQGPDLGGPIWSEVTDVKMRAFLHYKNGRMGLLESDGIGAGGTHLFFQDADGTYWWHRWDMQFPRQLLKDSQDGAANGSQPIRSGTNGEASAAGSRR
jgi:hypothetical protein